MHPVPFLIRILVSAGVCLFLTVQPSHAERKYLFSSRLDLYGGASNSLSGTGQSTHAGKKISAYYSGSPSLDLKTIGESFQLDASYAFSYQRYQQEEQIEMESHTAGVQFRMNPGERLRLSLNNQFYSTPDYLTYSLSRNIIPFEEGFYYAYTPEPSRQSFKTNSTRVSLEWDVGAQSYLTFSANGNYLDYAETSDSIGRLSDQYRYGSSFGYSYRSSEYTTWTVSYIASRNHYQNYGRSLSQSATFGFSHQLRPSVLVTIRGGPSYVMNPQPQENYLGYTATLRISKSTESTRISLSGTHRSGSSSGFGNVSDVDQGGFGFSFKLSRTVSASFNSSAYRSRQRNDSPLNPWGVDGGLHISWMANRYFQAGCGGSYRRTEESGDLNREYKQAYISISLLAPEFWKIMK